MQHKKQNPNNLLTVRLSLYNSLHAISYLQLMRRQVDCYRPHRRIPSIQLTAKFSIQDSFKIPELFHRVSLLGVKEPGNLFIIEIDPSRPITHQNPTKGNILCTIYHFFPSYHLPNPMHELTISWIISLQHAVAA